ncbi:PEP-CTERM sorting domain-containing protein [Paucibacter sp. XJ19-41]|uniref:PEP-CTERM sorting domain-containing protein n=1 Tax=Paucibacter sp. XJ19-41 TaxID=2927824 RepID=UPI00234BCD77|nr:PEP-CTERM sorting domain-containing protein [Paucibacter sp. XJ19-41]MDC6166465.1 PEP-CTERM sorting domain-containing protein [Paucibacter sp. XJ19-41]
MQIGTQIVSLAAGWALAAAATASTGQLDTFSASKFNIFAGETVDFSASFSIGTDSYSNGGSNTTEPPPVEGYQVWEVNWYQTWSESVADVQLQAAGASFGGVPASSGSWSFSSTFADPGTYVVQLTGGWTTRTDHYISTETASRNCYNLDPEGGGGLQCDSWQWSYYDNTYSSDISSQFSPLSLTIEVAAPVPEPATAAMLALGLVVLAFRARSQGG